MDRGKTKNFIIVVLLAVNLFLLLLILLDRAETWKISGSARNDIVEVLHLAGIEAAPEIDFEPDAPAVYTRRRVVEAELEIVHAALGSAEAEDRGGSIIVYQGARGRATFHGTGDFAIEFEHGPEINLSTPKDALDYLNSLGMMGYYDAKRQGENPESEIILTSFFDSQPIYNSVTKLSCAGGQLILAEGTRLLDEFFENLNIKVLTMPTVVMRFLDAVRDSGSLCGELLEIELGMKIELSSSGGGSLVPVWRFITDTGDFYINGTSGRSELFSS